MIKATLWSCRVPEDLFSTLQQFSGSAIWSHCDCSVNGNSARRNWKGKQEILPVYRCDHSQKWIWDTKSLQLLLLHSFFFFLNHPFRRKSIRETVNLKLNTIRIFSVKFDVSVWGCEWRHITANAQKGVNRFELILPKLWAASMPASQSRSYINMIARLMCCYLSLRQYALATQNSPAYNFPHYTDVCRN